MKPINRLVVGISLAILVVAPISNAQVIEEITVTARKKSENLQDVPISVNVITSQMMDRMGIKDLQDVTKLDPSLVFDRGFAPDDIRVVVRGIDNGRGRPVVATVIDGVDISSEALATAGASQLISPRLIDIERIEIVKRPMLATLEKILLPLKARKNILATTYFHRGYEVALTEIGKLSQFDKVIIGNGMEGTTLFGVKETKMFIQDNNGEAEQASLSLKTLYDKETAQRIAKAQEELKPIKSTLETLVKMGENALKTGQGLASLQIASQAGTLAHLAGLFATAQEGFNQALAVLESGTCYEKLMQWIEEAKH